MSILETLLQGLKLDKKTQNVYDGNFFTVMSGSYRIAVVAIYSHRYTYPLTVNEEITVKPWRWTFHV